MLKYAQAPQKLFYILQHESSDILSWDSDGNSFRIHNIKLFENNILPKYFRRKFSIFESTYRNCLKIYSLFIDRKLSTFSRQLNLYGFKTASGNVKHVFYHPLFRSKDEYSILNIKRMKKSKFDTHLNEASYSCEESISSDISGIDYIISKNTLHFSEYQKSEEEKVLKCEIGINTDISQANESENLYSIYSMFDYTD